MKMIKRKNLFNFFALVLSLALFSTALIANTFSKYVTKTNAPFEGKDHLNYSVNAVFVIKNQEELFSAINQGYTYLQLDKSIANALIVTEKAETLHTDLIIDLNGVEIQRNGYEPILNIKPGVRLTVVDTSNEGRGGLYNPVGSVFNITGGTLTVVAGNFESGPRYSEYYSYNSSVLNSENEDTKRTVVEDDPKNVLMYVKQPDGTFSNGTQKSAPIIKSYPEKKGDVEYKHGNLYFDVPVTKGETTILPDTYCYYRTSEDVALDLSDTSMADWYYTYYVTQSGFDYVGVSPTSETDIKVTIFGYENTIKKASEIQDPKDYYAAIQMQSGTLDIQSGGFFSYFGVDTTACVNAQGGLIDVVEGEFSSRTPNAYSYTEKDVDIKEIDAFAFGTGYFDNYNWAEGNYTYNGKTYHGNLARKGESYCILNGGNADVQIGTGEFYSSNNSIISMNGGKLEVGGGEFTKRVTNGLQTSEIAHMSAIYMHEGELNLDNAQCNVLGDSTNGIYMLNGTLDVQNTSYAIEGDETKGIHMLHGKLGVEGGTCNIKGSDTYGIYSTVSGAGNFTVTDTSFVLTNGNGQTGIYAEDSQIVASTTKNAVIHIEGNNANGIHVKGDNSVVNANAYTYQLNGNYCNGIHMESGKLSVDVAVYSIVGLNGVGINMDNGTLVVNSADYYVSGDYGKGINMLSGKLEVVGGICRVSGIETYGIYSTVEGVNNFSVTDTVFNLRNGSNQTGIYARNGKIKLNKQNVDDAHISISGPNGKGIWVDGGAVDSSEYDYFINGDTSYGIYSTGGMVNVHGGNVLLYSNVTCYGIYALSTDNSALDIKLNGVTTDVGYSSVNEKESGTVESSIGVFLATNNPNNVVELTDTNVYCYEVGVALSGGKLNVIGSGEIKTKRASAIVVMDGDLTFENQSAYAIESSSTVNDQISNVYNLTVPVLNNSSVNNVAYDNADGVFVSGGTFTSNGDISITHTGLLNDIDKWNSFSDIKITSFAVRVEGGAVVINKGSITSSVGGGVICNGGNVTLGNENSQRSDISITTTGNQVQNSTWESVNHNDARNDNSWDRRRTYTGGHAMEINNGNLVVYEGSYLAAHGDGIKLNAPKYSGSGPRTTVTIHNGSFDGQMENDISGNRSGPAGCYGVKVYGPAVITIYDGVFNGRAGGACVGGAYQYNYSSNTISYDLQYKAEVYIHKAKFGTTSVPNDGFMIYDNSKIVFGVGGADIASPDAITVNSNLAAFSVNWMTYRTYNGLTAKSCDVSVYYGTYSGSFQGWNKNNQASQIVVYNVRPGLTNRTTTGQYGDSINDRNNNTAIFYPTTA